VSKPWQKLPLFAYCTAERPATKIMLLDDSNWEKMLASVDEREKDRFMASRKGRKTMPKRLLPLIFEQVDMSDEVSYIYFNSFLLICFS
jgi:hypothetical protein